MGLAGTKASSDGLTGSLEYLFFLLTCILKIFWNIFIVLYLITKYLQFVFYYIEDIKKYKIYKNCGLCWHRGSGSV